MERVRFLFGLLCLTFSFLFGYAAGGRATIERERELLGGAPLATTSEGLLPTNLDFWATQTIEIHLNPVPAGCRGWTERPDYAAPFTVTHGYACKGE